MAEASKKMEEGLLTLSNLQKRMMTYVEAHADEELQTAQGGVTQRSLSPVAGAGAQCP
jgi:hypothetical protein